MTIEKGFTYINSSVAQERNIMKCKIGPNLCNCIPLSFTILSKYDQLLL